MSFTYTIGRNCQLVLLWNGARIDLRDVTGFTASQEVKHQRTEPLNSLPIEFTTPSGWRGEFSVDRGNSAVDDLVVQIESAFWASGTIGSGTIYQYVTEPDGTLSTYEFTGVALVLSNVGSYQSDAVVKQKIGFFASQRNKL